MQIELLRMLVELLYLSQNLLYFSLARADCRLSFRADLIADYPLELE